MTLYHEDHVYVQIRLVFELLAVALVFLRVYLAFRCQELMIQMQLSAIISYHG